MAASAVSAPERLFIFAEYDLVEDDPAGCGMMFIQYTGNEERLDKLHKAWLKCKRDDEGNPGTLGSFTFPAKLTPENLLTETTVRALTKTMSKGPVNGDDLVLQFTILLGKLSMIDEQMYDAACGFINEEEEVDYDDAIQEHAPTLYGSWEKVINNKPLK